MLTVSVSAQKYKSVFKNLTWEQAAELAQKEGKDRVGGRYAKSENPGGSEKTRCCRAKIVLYSGIMNFFGSARDCYSY